MFPLFFFFFFLLYIHTYFCTFFHNSLFFRSFIYLFLLYSVLTFFTLRLVRTLFFSHEMKYAERSPLSNRNTTAPRTRVHAAAWIRTREPACTRLRTRGFPFFFYFFLFFFSFLFFCRLDMYYVLLDSHIGLSVGGGFFLCGSICGRR